MTEQRFDRTLLAPMIAGAVLNPVNSSILAVSLIPIGVAFGAPPAETSWLVSALYLATAVGQPVVGRLIDVHGPRRLFLAATTLVGAAGVLGALAPGLGVLIAARVLLGFGTCAGYPAAMRLIRGEAERTGQDSPAGVLTALAVCAQTVAVVGPPLGGVLIGLGGWRATLAVNVPLALVAAVLGARWLPRSPRAERRPDLDLPGMALFAGALVALLLFLVRPSAAHWYLPVLAVAAGAGFAVREFRAAEPFLDLRVLVEDRALLRTYCRAVLAYSVSYAFLYGYTQWLEDGRGLSATMAGMVQLPVFATAILVSGLTGRSPRVRGKLIGGAVAQLAACGLMAVVEPSTAVWALIAVALVAGIPQGLNGLALQNSVYHQADPERIGSSAGLLRTSTYLGALVASAAQGAFYGSSADTGGLHHLAVLLLVVGGVFLVITLADRGLGRVGAAA